MRVLVSALGSAGDVHPFVAVAEVLLARGHDVTIIASPAFEATVRRAGAGFAPYGTADDYARLLQRPELWDPRGGARFIIEELLRTLPEAYALTAALAGPDTVLVGSTLSWAMRLVQERTGLRGATVHLSPACLLSAQAPPVLPGIGDLSWMPRTMRAFAIRAADRLVLDRMISPRLNTFRATLGLAPVERIWTRWMHSPDVVVGAWPEWFAATQADWPPRTTTAGFPLFDDHGRGLDGSLAAFLDAGDAPVAITPGSAMAHGARFVGGALAACTAIGRRAVVVTPYRAQLPAPLPSSAHHVGYAPFGALLRRVAALIHHGGIGTGAQALASGVPQVVAPFAHDQPDNAARLRRLGVATVVRPDAKPVAWIAALSAALDDARIADAVDVCARRMAAAEPASLVIARLVEGLGRGACRPASA